MHHRTKSASKALRKIENLEVCDTKWAHYIRNSTVLKLIIQFIPMLSLKITGLRLPLIHGKNMVAPRSEQSFVVEKILTT